MTQFKFGFFTILCTMSLLLANCSLLDDWGGGHEDDDNNDDDITMSDPCDEVNSTFKINLDPDDCTIDLNTESEFEMLVDEAAGQRSFSGNSIPGHLVGAFPNPGNPNTITSIDLAVSMTLNPELAPQTTTTQRYKVGILLSGIQLETFTGEFFTSADGTVNRDWNITTLTTTRDLGLDCNNAHVQPPGLYHYHGTPSAYLEELGADGSDMVKVGYAADGFPIYYKYGYSDDGARIVELSSGYRIKDGERPGDDLTAPGGCYDGTYFQDYEYVDGASMLDQCNGRWGKTPESDNEYYYVITDNFPSNPMCFSGTPDPSFGLGGGGGGPGGPNGG